MAITVGVDTYVTVAEADEYIASYYVSTDERRIEWETLSTEDKEVYLRNSVSKLEILRYQGRKCDGNEQTLSFPRRRMRLSPERRNYNSDRYNYEYELLDSNYYWDYDYGYECDKGVPNDIKNAQILEAFELAVPSSDTGDYEDYTGNVVSYSITGLSETFKTSSNNDNSTLKSTIISKQARRLLAKYIGGGYRIG